MIKLVIGFVLGVAVATVGFGGIAKLLDKGVDQLKTQTQEMAK